MAIHSTLIPNFIESGSPKALRSLMIKTNVKDKARNQYFDISSYVDARGRTRWIAWYYSELTTKQFVELAEENE